MNLLEKSIFFTIIKINLLLYMLFNFYKLFNINKTIIYGKLMIYQIKVK